MTRALHIFSISTSSVSGSASRAAATDARAFMIGDQRWETNSDAPATRRALH
jgi:hypothetical protein